MGRLNLYFLVMYSQVWLLYAEADNVAVDYIAFGSHKSLGIVVLSCYQCCVYIRVELSDRSCSKVNHFTHIVRKVSCSTPVKAMVDNGLCTTRENFGT